MRRYVRVRVLVVLRFCLIQAGFRIAAEVRVGFGGNRDLNFSTSSF